MAFHIELEQLEQGQVTAKVIGVIDGPPDSIPEIDKDAVLSIDLDRVKAINSVGIRAFMKWVHPLENEKISLIRVPKVIVDQINMVSDFIPQRFKVTSFYVPYFSDATGEERNILYSKDVNFKKSGEGPLQVIPPETKDSHQQAMQIDVSEKKYFRFLEKHI